MAILKIVSVRDSAMNAFGRPIFVPSLGVAIRSFTDEVNRKDDNNQMNVHPDDFELFEIGEFEEADGLLVACPPRSLARAKDVIRSE